MGIPDKKVTLIKIHFILKLTSSILKTENRHILFLDSKLKPIKSVVIFKLQEQSAALTASIASSNVYHRKKIFH